MSNGDLAGRVIFEPSRRRRIAWSPQSRWAFVTALVASTTASAVVLWLGITNETEPNFRPLGLLGLALIVVGALMSSRGDRDVLRAIGRGLAWGPLLATASSFALWGFALAQVGPT